MRTGNIGALLDKGKLAEWVGTVGKGRVQEATGRELRMWMVHSRVDGLLRTGKMAPSPSVKAIVLFEPDD